MPAERLRALLNISAEVLSGRAGILDRLATRSATLRMTGASGWRSSPAEKLVATRSILAGFPQGTKRVALNGRFWGLNSDLRARRDQVEGFLSVDGRATPYIGLRTLIVWATLRKRRQTVGGQGYAIFDAYLSLGSGLGEDRCTRACAIAGRKRRRRQ